MDNMYTYLYAKSLDVYIAKKKSIEEKSKELSKAGAKLRSEYKLTNPGQSLVVKEKEYEKSDKSIIYVHAQARPHQARRG